MKTPTPKQPTCAVCGGTGKFSYWTCSSGKPIRVSVRCLSCQPKPPDPWKFHN